MVYKRIRDLREDSDKRQRELAEYLHCSQSTYSDYENGKLDLPSDVLILLALLYGTSVDYILGLTDEIQPLPRN